MTAHTDLLLQCFQAAAKAAQPALERCILRVVADLQALEMQSMKVAERDALSSNWRYLQARKAEWPERYAANLLLELNQFTPKTPAANTDAQPALHTSSGRFKTASFGLVDEADMTQAIRGQRLLQDLLPVVDQSLAELDALVSSAMGLGYVAPERNPLKPEVFARLLQNMMTASLEDNEATSQSFKLLAKPLGQEINKIYQDCTKTLKQAQVQSVSYQVKLQPVAPQKSNQQPNARTTDTDIDAETALQDADQGSNGGDRFDLQPQPAPLDWSNRQATAQLLNDFLSPDFQRLAGNAARTPGRATDQTFGQPHSRASNQVSCQALSAPYYDNIEQELADLKAAPASRPVPFSSEAQAQRASMPAVDRPQRAVDASSPLSEQVWGPYGTSRARNLVRTELKKEATQVNQVLGLDVVRQLVNQVAQDQRLLAPVREAIVALEPSLLRLALVDPRFFTDERHAGRQLMERVAQRSFKYNDEYSAEFAWFFQGISQSFNQLNAADVQDAQPFAGALAALEQTWDAQDQEDFDKRQQVLQALRFAEERQTKADLIAFNLSARSDLQNVPGKVLDFLFGRWALVMAHAKLIDTRNQIDPFGYGSVVPDLLWSVKRDVTLKQPAKLIEMIPGLLDRLHKGLDLLGQDPVENEAFFESLMKLHRPVLKLRRLKSQRDAEESNTAPLQAEPDQEQEPDENVSPAERLEKLRSDADAQLWMGRNDLEAAGFEDTLPTEPAELGSDVVQAQAPTNQTPAESVCEPLAEATAKLLEPEPQLTGSVADEDNADAAKPLAASVLQQLKTGQWVDLYSKRQWHRAQLVWASSKATLFMFISHGGRPHSMTQRSCEKLIAQRLLRPVDAQGVVAQALDAVAQDAAAKSQSEQTREDLGQDEFEAAYTH